MKALKVTDLHYTYPDGTIALKGIDLEIPENSRVALLGANGSGKTTLIYHLNGLILPQQGTVHIYGTLLCKKALASIRQKVGLLFDSPDNQLFSTTVLKDVSFGPRNMGLNEKIVLEKSLQALELMHITELRDRPPFHLSLGQKKKAAIAGILAMEPLLFVLDEPFSGLDPFSSRQLMERMDTVFKRGSTLIISTHDVNLAYAWADQVIILGEGRVLGYGNTALLTDRKLMNNSNLEMPVLAEAFCETGFAPKDTCEAKLIIKTILNKQ